MAELTCEPADTAAIAVSDAGAAARPATRSPQRAVLVPGGLAGRAALADGPLVVARDTIGNTWLIPAAAVWTDVVTDDATNEHSGTDPAPTDPAGDPAESGPTASVVGRPDARHTDVGRADGTRWSRPRTVGLAVGSTWAAAMLAGLSDRLGWEAVAGLDVGADVAAVLPPLDGPARAALADDPASSTVLRGHEVQLLDGRRTEVPTVVVAGDGVLRWGAGGTWPLALQRALFGDAAEVGYALTSDAELDAIATSLAAGALEAVGVDLGTATLGQAGIARVSVQLMVAAEATG